MKKRILSIFVAFAMLLGTVPAVFADGEASALTTSFNQDFEAYDADVTWSNYVESTSAGNRTRHYISNGATAKTMYAANNMTLIQGTWSNGTGVNPSGTEPYLVSGGLEGYTGLYGMTGALPVIFRSNGGVMSTDHGKVQNLFILDEGTDNKALYFESPLTSVGYNSSMFGKDGLDLYGNKSKISFSYKNLSSTDALTTLSITKNTENLGDIMSAMALSKGTNAGVVTRSSWGSGYEATDAVIIYNGAAYLGSAFDAETKTLNANGKICDVASTGVYYTIDVYLDYSTTTPVVTVAVKDEDNNIIGLKSGNLITSTNDTSIHSFKTAYTNNTNGMFYEGVNGFSTLKSDTGYGAYVVCNASTSTKLQMYLDNFGMKPFKDSDVPTGVTKIGREFAQDFESSEYDAVQNFAGFYNSNTDTFGGKRYYTKNGKAAAKALAADNRSLADGELYTNMYAQDGTLQKPAASLSYGVGNNITLSSLNAIYKQPQAFGGLKGYTGISGVTGYEPYVFGANGPYVDNTIRGKKKDLFVVDDGNDNKALYTEVLGGQGFNTSWFGKDGLDLYGYKTKLSFAFNNPYNDIKNNGITTLTITKGTSKWKGMLASAAQTYASTHTKNLSNFNANVQATDAVVIYNGKAYLGNGMTSSYAIDESKYICDVNEAGVYYTVDVYLDYELDDEEDTIPLITVVVKDETGHVIGRKSGALPVATSASCTSVNAVSKAGINPGLNMLLSSNGNNTDVYFTNEAASSYGAYLTSSMGVADSAVYKCTYFDNFMMSDYDDSEIPSLVATASLDADAKTVKVKIDSASGISAKLIAGEYTKNDNALIQTATADVTANGEYTLVFENALTADAEYIVYLWKDFETIEPLIRSFAPTILSE